MLMILLVALGSISQTPSKIPEPPTYQVMDELPGSSPLAKFVLLRTKKIQEELKLSDDQEKRKAALDEQFQRERQKFFEGGDGEKIRADFARRRDEFEKQNLDLLKPSQKARLDQMELQLNVLSAFEREELPGRLGLSEQKTKEVRAIVAEGVESMEKASSFLLPPSGVKVPNSLDDVLKLVRSPEFRASKEKAWDAVFEARRKTLGRVEQALTDRQREEFRKFLGKPFDVESLWEELSPRQAPVQRELAIVAIQFGFSTGQRADPEFDTKIARPAYSGDRHPRVLFDEAHHNFHTSNGRYKVFAELIDHDGYKVIPNHDPFRAKVLADLDILVIANALGAEGMGHPDAAKSAFTETECDAVRDWVEAGGSLLLITDHQPFGDSADLLARRFEVDMSKGVADDPSNETERGLLFSRQKGLIVDHAITRGRDESERVDRVLTFTGQSLKGPPGSVPFLKFSDTATDRRQDKEVPAVGRAQGIAFARGKGRVVVMSEAAQLSAQVYGFPPTPMGMNAAGCDNRKMALNTMHWLSRLID